jgi:outer membrane receptor protein involved in Fe transport
LALAVFSTAAAAQTGKITGIVTDAESGAPLDGAQVILQGSGLQTLTGSNGRYVLINIPPGTYSILARRIGYQGAEFTNVLVQIDVTRTVDFPLAVATATTVEAIKVTDEVAPLVQPGTTGSGINIQADEIASLPVTNITGILALQQGFLEIPQNTDIVAFADTRRNPLNPISIRGGRGGETQTSIDGVPINNFVFGGRAFDINNAAVEQLDFQRGGFEAQYGNALSGVINIATREGGTRLAGSLQLESSAVGGALGNRSDELLDFTQLQGFVSGPVPGTNSKLRFMVSGRNESGADRVLEFDTIVNDPSSPQRDADGDVVNVQGRDVFEGWRAFGYSDVRDIIGKVTLLVRPTMKLSVSAINYRGQRQGFDFDWLLTGYDPLTSPVVDNVLDSLSLAPASGFTSQGDVVYGSIWVNREVYSAKWDHTIGRWAYKAAVGKFDQERETCNFFNGVCLGRRFADVNFTEQFHNTGVTPSHAGTDQFFGGEKLKSVSGRVDFQGQATDHHFLQFGAAYQKHDLVYQEFQNVGTNDVTVLPFFYAGKPWEAAFYLADKIEYDFLTIKLGARFDMGEAGGLFFADPRDPTNSTTAREVCNGEYPGIDAFSHAASGTTGFAACTTDRTLLDSATVLAQGDDFVQNRRRNQFSPRIGVSFPLSERSQVFFNFGRYSQNPLYNNVYRNTGTGTIAGDSLGVCRDDQVVPNTDQCYPIIFSDFGNTGLVGNPNLLIEKTTSYEIGYITELGSNFSLQTTAYSKDQFGLTGVRRGGRDALGNFKFDVGSTYGQGQYNYTVLVNQDFQTVRGFEVTLRRRLANFWSFNVNYGFSQATTNASAPDQEFQRSVEESDPAQNQEIRSQIDQPHTFNAQIQLRVGRDEPFGIGILDKVVRNSSASVTMSAASGFTYTPTVTFAGSGAGGQLQRNSGRAPATMTLNLGLSKDFQISNVRYGLQLRVANLLDAKHCAQVFPSTGRCDYGSIDQDRRATGNAIGEGATTTVFDRPQFYRNRRSINFGARMNF